MKEEFLSTESTNRRLKASSSTPNFLYDYNCSFLNNHTQNRKLNYKAKKIIEKYTYKGYKDEYSNNDISLSLSYSSKDIQKSYKKFCYKEGDDYDILVNKNKNLKRLFEQANCSLILSLQKQEKMEIKYEKEKKDILEKLSKIQEKYELYAESHQRLNDIKGKTDEITNSYGRLLASYLKLDCQFKKFKDKIEKIYDNINTFIENCYKEKTINILSFEYLLHIKKEISDKLKISDELNSTSNKYMTNNLEKERINNKIHTYYTKKYHNNDYTKRNDKIKNKFNKTTNYSLINRYKNDDLINNKLLFSNI
jgi:hypothetical protein